VTIGVCNNIFFTPLSSQLISMVKYNLFYVSSMITVGILTISDKGSKGQRLDKSGEAVKEGVSSIGSKIAKYKVIPDEKDIITATLRDWADDGDVDVIFTTGGTGLGKRDITPEATLSVIDRNVPGIAEAMRIKSLEKTPMAMLSRSVAGQRGQCLIINLPGSPKAVRECLGAILSAIPHAVEIIKGEVTEHSLQDAPLH
jgi:molybdopterin adenylyltransferase